MGRRRHSSDSRSSSRSRSRSRRRSYSRSPRRRGRRRSRSGSTDAEGARLHVSEIPLNCDSRELERTFEKFGPLVEVWKTNCTPCFAFVVFRHKDAALEAIRGLNGQYICGGRVRVTMALPRARERRRQPVFHSDSRCYQCGQPGHFSRSCRNYEGAGRNRMVPSPRHSRRRRQSSSSSRSRSRSRSHRPRSRNERSHSRHRRRSSDRQRDGRLGSRGDDLNAEDIIAAQSM